MTKFYIFFWCMLGGAWVNAGTIGYADRRQRIIFVNQAPEDVYVAIHKDPSIPLEREMVPSGTRTYFFPRVLDEQSFYYIVIKSSSHEAHYTLHLSGNLLLSDTHACRAYGELQLMAGDWIIQTVGAGSVAQGIVLTYNHDFELRFGLVYLATRPHKPECRSQCRKTGYCICRSACAAPTTPQRKSSKSG